MTNLARRLGMWCTLCTLCTLCTDAWAQPEILKQTFDFFDKHKAKKK